jgi:hypothetical protein
VLQHVPLSAIILPCTAAVLVAVQLLLLLLLLQGQMEAVNATVYFKLPHQYAHQILHLQCD